MYEGEIIRLRRLVSDDAMTILENWNDYSLRRFFPHPYPRTLSEIEEFIQSRNEGFKDRYVFTFGIEEKTTGKLLGFVDLGKISWVSSTGCIDNIAIFDHEDQGKGYGKDATKVLLDFAFNILNLHHVHLYVYATNIHAINFYETFGFKKQGTLREAAFLNGQRDDILIMDILKPEFLERYGILPK